MDRLVDVARIETTSFLAVLAAVVGYQLVVGRINMRGLLESKCASGVSPGRVQLLFSTLIVAILLLAKLGAMRETGKIELPSAMSLFVLGSSNLTYLAGKFWRKF